MWDLNHGHFRIMTVSSLYHSPVERHCFCWLLRTNSVFLKDAVFISGKSHFNQCLQGWVISMQTDGFSALRIYVDGDCNDQPCEYKIIANFLSMLCHNLLTIYANNTNCLLLVQNLMSFFLQFTETGYYIYNYRYALAKI